LKDCKLFRIKGKDRTEILSKRVTGNERTKITKHSFSKYYAGGFIQYA